MLVRVKAAGVNPVDTYFREGNILRYSLPYTPGLDGAGLVEEVGDGVEHLKVCFRIVVWSIVKTNCGTQLL